MADKNRPVAGNVRELKPRSRPIRKTIKVLLVLALLLVAAHWGAGRYARSRLDAALDAYRRAGEPIEPKDFLEPLPPPEQNAAVDWIAAADLIDTSSPAWTEFYRLDDVAIPLDQAETATINAVLRLCRDALRRVDVATSKPLVVWPRGPDNPIGSDNDPWRRTYILRQILHASALQAHQLGDDHTAVARVGQMIALARAVDCDPLLYAHNSAVASHAWACDTVFELAPDLGADVTAQLRPLIAVLLDDHPLRDSLVRAMKGERATAWRFAHSFASGERDLRGFRAPGWQTMMFAYGWRPLVLYDTPIVLRHAGEIAAAAAIAENWQAFQEWAPGLDGPSEYRRDPRLHLFAGIFGHWPQHHFRTHFAALADRHLAATALAIRCYSADHDGRLPSELDELVPNYLPTLPVDPMAHAGRTLGYRSEGSDPILYSVGNNGTDDLGSSALPDNRPLSKAYSPDRWQRLDAVVHLTRQPRSRPAPERDDHDGD